MELLQLKYFMSVAKHQHVTKAAEELFVAQPSISQSISRLEKELEVRLFDRVGKTIQINEYGRALLKRCEVIFQSLEELETEFQIIRNAPKNGIRVLIWPNSSIVPQLLAGFRERYPYVELRMTEEAQEGYDFRFSMGSYDAPPHPCEMLHQEEVRLAIAHAHPLARFNSIALSELRDEPFVAFPPNKPYRQIMESYCRLAGFEPRIAAENDHYGGICELIRMQQGAALVPSRSWGDINTRYVKLIRIENPICMRNTYLSWPEDKQMDELDLIFREFAREYFSRL